MKPLSKILSVFLPVAFSFTLYAQEPPFSNHTLYSKRKPGYLELQIVETNSVLKVANKAVPFDKVFYLKIKRLKTSGETAITSKRTVVVDTVLTKEQEANRKIQETRKELKEFPIEEPKEKLHNITIIEMTEEDGERMVKIIHHLEGSVYMEKDFAYIRINPLNPEKSYTLQIKWDNGVTEAYRISTVIPTFKGRLSTRILPQMGISVAGFRNGPMTRYKPSLLFGIDYHPFRPIDPDVPIHTFKPLACQRFSFLLGLTLNSLAEENKRENLFNKNNLMAGLAYQPYEGVRISYGGVFFFQNNPDLMYSSQKRFAATSYLAVTLDLRLNEFLGGIITALGLKP